MVTSTTTSPAPLRGQSRFRWRVVDIVVAAVLGVAAGFVFLAWNLGYQLPGSVLEAALPGLQGLVNGVWLFAGVLGGLIIRKPGAAIFTELVAAVVSALAGNQWGSFLTFEAGIVQGLGAELVLLAFLYRRWSLPVAVLAGAGAGLFGAVNDLILWYPGSGAAFATIYLASSVVSGAVLAGGLSWILARALARTGALSRFAAGRESVRV
ncbi:ECF transporter S component [Naasia sp. SYSU D00057]|uniref:ECF transporter S component n=1 Tax=Naasia sp. SYSU D00057 TaxID=2817380 RepID=UPI001B309C36|nr:ECF transporter S component [Naasia sp. SYSU D00057]